MDTEVATSALSRRERKKQQTREALRAAALRLFAERGFHETTVEDITNAADLSPRTFFLHFGSKEEVLFGTHEQYIDKLRDRLAAAPLGADPVEAMRRVTRTLIDEIGEPILCLLRHDHHSPAEDTGKLRHFVQLERFVAEQVAAATGLDARTDLYPTLVAQVVFTTLRAALTVWLERDAATRLGDLVDEAFAALAAGLAPQAPPAAQAQTRGSPE